MLVRKTECKSGLRTKTLAFEVSKGHNFDFDPHVEIAVTNQPAWIPAGKLGPRLLTLDLIRPCLAVELSIIRSRTRTPT